MEKCRIESVLICAFKTWKEKKILFCKFLLPKKKPCINPLVSWTSNLTPKHVHHCPLPLEHNRTYSLVTKGLLEEFVQKSLSTLDQILHLSLYIIGWVAAVMMARLLGPSAWASATTAVALAPTRSARTALNEMLNLAATSAAFAGPHKGASVAPSHAHDTRLATFPACLCVGSVENAPDLWATGAIDEHKVAMTRAIRRRVVASGFEKRVV